MRSFRFRLLLVAIPLLSLAQTPVPLSNQHVILLVESGLPPSEVIRLIGSARAVSFDLTPSATDKLLRAGVSEETIKQMAAREVLGPSYVPDTPRTTISPHGNTSLHSGTAERTTGDIPTPALTEQVSEVGIYVDKKGVWAELSPEIVYFKTGGVLKKIGTVGIVKGDVNGHINKPRSPNSITSLPAHFLVYTPGGVAITEYQLLRLREQGKSREFRTLIGGVLHVSGGATRDVVPFESKRIAPRTYDVVLSGLSLAEYGFLPPSSSDSTGSTGRIGKIYSFRVVE